MQRWREDELERLLGVYIGEGDERCNRIHNSDSNIPAHLEGKTAYTQGRVAQNYIQHD
jgi:hypothetical protein